MAPDPSARTSVATVDEAAIVIRNPSRWQVPAGISAAIVIMFLPPLLLSILHSVEHAKAALGALAVTATALYFAYSAVTAPIEARIGKWITIRRAASESRYDLSQVRRWFFAVPNGLPTHSAPGTNALLHMVLQDRTYFRGEVTADEAAFLADCLSHVANTNANAELQRLCE